MRTRLKLLAAAGGLLVATGALAQPYPPAGPPPGPPPHAGYGGGYDSGTFWRGAPDSPRERIQFLQDRISRGIADGSLDRREGWRAQRDLNGIRQWVRRMHYDNGGRLSPGQRADVQARLDDLSRRIRWMRHNGW